MAKMMSVAEANRNMKLGPQFDSEKCEAEEELRRGRFAQGFKGKMMVGRYSGRPVAIKVFDVETPISEDVIREEANIMKSLSHPHVVQFYGLFNAVDTDKILLIMEFVNGGDLEEALALMKRPVTHPELGKWCTQIANAVDYLHSRGVIHRDLCPRNIHLMQPELLPNEQDTNYWVCQDMKIGDFGASKLLPPGTIRTKTFIRGDLSYMAPELLSDKLDHLGVGKSYDKRIDVWSFGAIIFQMVRQQRLVLKKRDKVDTKALANAVVADVEKVQTLEFTPPVGICSDFWHLVLRAVHTDAAMRPKLTDIVKAKFIKSNYEQAMNDIARLEVLGPKTPATGSRARAVQLAPATQRTPAARPTRQGQATPATAPPVAASDRITRSMAKAQLAAGKKP